MAYNKVALKTGQTITQAALDQFEAGVAANADALDALPATYVQKAGPLPTSRRTFPMRTPRVLASPPSVTAGSSSASTVTGSVFVSCFEPGAFTYLGGRVVVKDPANPHPVGASCGPYPFKTSSAPVIVETWLDSADAQGRFEVYWAGASTFTGMRVVIQQPDGTWGYVSAASTFAHTQAWTDLVTLGAPGVYRIRLELPPNGTFNGLYVGPTDTVTATIAPKRWIVVGDSFTEPTFDDSGAYVAGDGFVQQLAYLTGYDLWSAGLGGTGYLNPNSGANRVKFLDRLAADILAFKPDGILWAGGINDSSYAPADVAAAALACFQAAKDAGVPEQVVLSPFWSKTLTVASPPNVVAMSDGIKAAATSLGLRYLNLLEMPEPTGRLADWGGSTLQAAVSVSNSTISVASIPTYMQVNYVTKGGWYVKIGSGANTEIRRVTNISGSGPYTLTLNSGLTFAWTAGQPVVLSGAQYITGTGKQGSTTGSGNADRYTGAGGTHYTKAGAGHIARTVAGLWAQALLA